MKSLKYAFLASCIGSSLATSAHSATIFNYTEQQSGGNNIALGYTVPIPVDSLTPIDGFRTYSSLMARHQQMANDVEFITGQIVGQTFEDEDIWMYVVSNGNDKTQSGAPKGAILINGGIHAREWQSPEVVTGFIERLYDNHDNQYLEHYLIDNLKMSFIPVLNIDGFKQTQRYPTQVTSAINSPRDGRMRRKNKNGVDDDINTDSDNLFGVDLNRNSNPFWASSTASSSSPDSLVYHGESPGSEPEIQALINAGNLSPNDKLRLFLDVHSFTQIYFTPMTGHGRRDNITEKVMGVMRAANNFKYAYGPSSAGTGIGTTADYFANLYEIPSATLETEPGQNGASQYGGNGVSHDGFILPNNQVRRMVQETSTATLSGFYAQAEKPVLQQVIIRDAGSGEVVVDGQWQPSVNGRELVFDANNSLSQNTDYRVSLVFNKPMRWIGQSGQISHFPSMITTLEPQVQWLGEDNSGNAIAVDVDTAEGVWQVNQATEQNAGFARYKTDTFSFTTNFGDAINWQALTRIAIAVNTTDMVQQNLDANPATTVDFANGQWSGYEDNNGDETDLGGSDKSFRLVDDGSDLFNPSDGGGNTPTPTPTTPEPVLSGGGGSLGLFSGLLLMLGLRRRF